MTIAIQKRTLGQVFIGEPLELAKDQPHQVLLSTGSVAIMAQFAAHGGIVEPWVGYAIAIGVEWAYLRGLASDSKARTRWGDALNWSAFGIVVLWGVLWVATIYGAIPARVEGWPALLLAAAHIVPIAWLALCSAQCHRAMMRVETIKAEEREREELRRALERNRLEEERARLLQAEQDKIAIELARKKAEIEAWQEARKVKAQLAADLAQLETRNQGTQPAQPARQPIIIDGVEYPTIQAAADAHGITRQAMSKRLRR